MKTCSCGIQYIEIPKDAIETELGWWYNCTCKSTLFWKNPNWTRNSK